MPMQQKDRRSGAAMPHPNHDVTEVYSVERESLEHRTQQ